MAQVNLPYVFANQTTADANQVDQNFNAIAAQVNGNLDETNIKPSIITKASLASEAVTPTKSEGLTYNQDLFGGSFLYSGFTCTKDGTNLNQVDVTSGIAYITQTDGTIRRLNVASTNFKTVSASATYYLDLNPDGTYSWATGHSTTTGYVNVATVTSDASSNINVITQNSANFSVTLMQGATGPVKVNGLSASGFNTVDYWL